jgi:hypothetical protein
VAPTSFARSAQRAMYSDIDLVCMSTYNGPQAPRCFTLRKLWASKRSLSSKSQLISHAWLSSASVYRLVR